MKGNNGRGIWLVVLVALMALGHGRAMGCSEILLAGAGEVTPVISARTMDFDYNLYSRFVAVPRNLKWTSFVPLDQWWKSPVSWTNKYAFVGVDSFDGFKIPLVINGRKIYSDGMNEKGLSAGALWLADSKYHDWPLSGKALASIDLVGWILGNFSTVQEVIDALNKDNPDVDTWDPDIIGYFDFPLHIVVHDVRGRSVVIEWSKDKDTARPVLWYDNGSTQSHLVLKGKGAQMPLPKYVEVLTNDPIYPKQLENLWKDTTPYTNEDPWDKSFGGYREGGGLLNLPGDHDPLSRFVRLYHINDFSTQRVPGNGNHVDWRVAQAFRVIGQVDGIVGEQDAYFHAIFVTLWTLVRDHSNMRIYFTGAQNQSAQVVDLKEMEEKGYFSKDKITPLNWADAPANKVGMDSNAVGGETWGAPSKEGGLLDLSVRIPVLSKDKSSHGKVYIFANLPDGSHRVMLPDKSWTVLKKAVDMTPYLTGKLSEVADKDILVFHKEAPDDWAGADLYAGYGRSFADMCLRGTFVQFYSFPNK